MFREVIAAEGADPHGWPILADAIRRWEPELELYLPPRHARLYEPDGTLYAVALEDGMTVSSGTRSATVGRGDLLVVPEALALDVEPDTALLCVRSEGPPPPHFRERFIQVWGFEHVPAPSRGHGRSALVGTRDARHRTAYAILDALDARTSTEETGLDVFLFVGLDGNVLLRVHGHDTLELRPGLVAAVGPDSVVAVEGDGRVGRLILRSAPVHRGRMAEAPPAPEYDPTVLGAGSANQEA